MSEEVQTFHSNRLYFLLTKHSIFTIDILTEFHDILHEQPELACLTDPIEGSYFHLLCRQTNEHDNIAYRMIYALSNAGANVNITDENGNTPLHQALNRDFNDIGLDFIQALFRVGIDPRIVNNRGKTAEMYLDVDNPQLMSLFEGYGQGIWQAIESCHLADTERLIRGFIKIDCKNSSNKTLLDLARDLNSSEIIRLLADYQVTIEFLHSILAYDWQRVKLIFQYEKQFLKPNLTDTIHKLTWLRTTNRSYGKHFLEVCFETNSSDLFDLIFQLNVDVNCFSTDGLPFYFHMFNKCFSVVHRKYLYNHANFSMKSSKGETFLFYLIQLYIQNENEEYFSMFNEILTNHPLLITQRNDQGRTILEEIELTSTLIYNKLRRFVQSIQTLVLQQMKSNVYLERYILNGFSYHLYYLYQDQIEQNNKIFKDLIYTIQNRHSLVALMNELVEFIRKNQIEKFIEILKIKINLYLAKDWAGRTLAHLAVLYRRKSILKYLFETYPKNLELKDNLNRTPLHYAYIMNDEMMITILEDYQSKKNIYDCFDFLPIDYKNNRDLCTEEFHASNYPTNEFNKRLEGISDYLKMTFYFNIKKSIEENSIDNLKQIHQQMNTMGFQFEDFNSNSYINDWVHGQRYIPLLFIALEHRSVASFQYLISLGLPITGRMYISKSINQMNSRCVSFRTRAEELECFDIIGMINDFEDDDELKHVFKRHISSSKKSLNRQSSAIDFEQQQQHKSNERMKSQTCILS